VRFLKGFFAETLPGAAFGWIAVLRLDADLYSSTSDILYNLYDKVSLGGFVIIDDWCIVQCRQAVQDFRDAHGIQDEIVDIDGSGVYWRKTEHVVVDKQAYRLMMSRGWRGA